MGDDNLPRPADPPRVSTFNDVLALGVLGADRFRKAYPDDYARLQREHFARFEVPPSAPSRLRTFE